MHMQNFEDYYINWLTLNTLFWRLARQHLAVSASLKTLMLHCWNHLIPQSKPIQPCFSLCSDAKCLWWNASSVTSSWRQTLSSVKPMSRPTRQQDIGFTQHANIRSTTLGSRSYWPPPLCLLGNGTPPPSTCTNTQTQPIKTWDRFCKCLLNP